MNPNQTSQNLKRKFSLIAQKNSVPYSDENGNFDQSWIKQFNNPIEITDLVSTSKTFDSSNKLKVNADYTFGDLTSLTFDTLSIDSSPLGTTIKFNSVSTATVITDNSGIDWTDGTIPSPSANKTCLILIFNKMGFYKEW